MVYYSPYNFGQPVDDISSTSSIITCNIVTSNIIISSNAVLNSVNCANITCSNLQCAQSLQASNITTSTLACGSISWSNITSGTVPWSNITGTPAPNGWYMSGNTVKTDSNALANNTLSVTNQAYLNNGVQIANPIVLYSPLGNSCNCIRSSAGDMTVSSELGLNLIADWNGNNTGNPAVAIRFGIGNLTSNVYGYTEAMRMSTAGYLGVGTTTPAYKVDVVGDVNCSGNFRIGGTIIGGTTGLSACNVSACNVSACNVSACNVSACNITTNNLAASNATIIGQLSLCNALPIGSVQGGVFSSNTAVYASNVATSGTVAWSRVTGAPTINSNVASNQSGGWFMDGMSARTDCNCFMYSDINVTGTTYCDSVNANTGGYIGDMLYVGGRALVTGFIGAGTSTPKYQVDVNGQVNSTGYLINGVAINTTGGGLANGWYISGTSATTGCNCVMYQNATVSGTVACSQMNSSVGATIGNALTVGGNSTVGGYLGVRTLAPQYPIDVVGSVNCTGSYLINGVPINTTVTPTSTGWYMSGANTTTNSNCVINNALTCGSVTTAGTITCSSSLGVGTASPAYKIDVVGDVNCSGNFRINGAIIGSSASAYPTNTWLTSTEGANRFYFAPSGASFFGQGGSGGWIFQNASTQNVTTISSTGNLTAAGNLTANGMTLNQNLVAKWMTGNYMALNKYDTINSPQSGIYFADSNSIYNQLQITGSNDGFTFWSSVLVSGSGSTNLLSKANISITGAYTQISDSNQKNLIGSFDSSNCMGIVNQLDPVYYSYKSDESSALQSGFFAQDVQKLIPEAVTPMSGDMLGMNYTNIIPYLVSALQETNKQLASLSNAYYSA